MKERPLSSILRSPKAGVFLSPLSGLVLMRFSKTLVAENEEGLAEADTIRIPNATIAMGAEDYELKVTDYYGCDIESKTTTVEIIEKAVVRCRG